MPPDASGSGRRDLALVLPTRLVRGQPLRNASPLPFPQLDRLTAQGAFRAFSGGSLLDWLAPQFNLPQSPACAPLTACADFKPPVDGYWLRADPVCAVPTADSLLIHPEARFDCQPGELAAIAGAVTAVMAQTGMEFHPATSGRWYLCGPAPIDAQFPRLLPGASTDIEASLPCDPVRRWQRLLNEAQMCLAELPVNVAREARGALPLNSILFWGGGLATAVSPGRFVSVASNEPCTRGLGYRAGLPVAVEPANPAQWLSTLPAGSHLCVLGYEHGSGETSAESTGHALAALESDWAATIGDALARGALHEVELIDPGGGSWRFGRRRPWWRRAMRFSDTLTTSARGKS